jgi:hypothetical protein
LARSRTFCIAGINQNFERYARIPTVPRLSIVIPCPRCDEQFENTLASVLQNRPHDCEVLAVFSGVYDDPYDLQDEVRFLEMPSTSSLLDLINVGIDQAQGEVVHVLACGTEVEEGWTDAPLRRFDKATVGAVSPLVISRQASDGRAVAGIRYSRSGTRRVCRVAPARAAHRVPKVLGPSLCAAFYRREPLSRIGGLDIAVGENLADVDLAICLQAAGYQGVCESNSRVYVGAELPDGSWQFSAAARREYLFWKHARKFGWIRSLAAHCLVVVGEVVQSVIRPSMIGYLCGRVYGCVSRPSTANRTSAFSEQTMRPRRRQRNSSGHSEAGGDSAKYPEGRRRHVA